MNILIVNNTKIPVSDYGGSERVIWWLGKELVKLGHKVSYLAAEGSSCPFADVYMLNSRMSLNDQIPQNVDIVHLHFQPQGPIHKPIIVTHHGNYHPFKEFHQNTVFVSKDHAARNGSHVYVYNGIDPDDYGPVDFKLKRTHLLFMGWATRPEKNLKDSLYIAKKTKHVLAVIGGKDKWFKRRPWVSYKGFAGGEIKNTMINQSRALIFPVRWHEPFGLALLEALYFGCPVLGSLYGSLPELIIKEVGFLSNSRSDLVKAVNRLGDFDPKACHRYVCDQFTSSHMARHYIHLYEKVLSGQSLNPSRPQRGENYMRGELLPLFN